MAKIFSLAQVRGVLKGSNGEGSSLWDVRERLRDCDRFCAHLVRNESAAPQDASKPKGLDGYRPHFVPLKEALPLRRRGAHFTGFPEVFFFFFFCILRISPDTTCIRAHREISQRAREHTRNRNFSHPCEMALGYPISVRWKKDTRDRERWNYRTPSPIINAVCDALWLYSVTVLRANIIVELIV